MEKFGSRNIVSEMFDAFQRLHTNPFHPDPKETDKIIISIHDSLMTSESTRELHDLSQEYINLFQEWETKVREDDINGFFEQGLNDPFYSDNQYTAFHNFNSAIPEMLLKCTAVRANELIKQHGIPISLYLLLSLLEDLINTRHLSFGTVNENRGMINRAMVTDRANMHNTSTIDADLTDREIDAIERLQENLLTCNIVYDVPSITAQNLLSFHLLFDPVGYNRFQSKVLSEEKMGIK